MKKKLIYVLFAAFAITACGDDFAETPNVGALSDETLANPAGVDLLLTGTYSSLDGARSNLGGSQFSFSGDNWWFDVISDDAHKGSNNGDQPELFDLETNVYITSNSYFRGRFSALYAGVNRANSVLNVIQGIDLTTLTPDDATAIAAQEGEARFLRAHFNFELTRMYGNVSFISVENFANSEFNQPNSGPLWEQIEADLAIAISNLPATRADQSDAGRPTAIVARAYLGKALIYQQEFAQALTEFNAVIASGEFSLATEYLDNFTAAGENGSESVFAIQFATDGGQSLNGNQGGTLNFPGGGPFGSCCGFYQPSIDLANAFIVDGITGLPANLNGMLDFPSDQEIISADPFTPDMTIPVDPRLDYTVGRRGIDFNGFGEHIGQDWIRSVGGVDISGPYLGKKNVYQSAEIADNQGFGVWGQQHSGVNYNIIRYADVLLFAAEAAVETGDLATALNLVNQVRERAANSTQVQAIDGSGPAANYQIGLYPVFPDAAFARDAVRMERRVELGMEGQRLFDLRRWGVTVDVLNAYYANEGRTIIEFGQESRPYQAFQDLLPIPVNSIDLSQGALQQNPGY